MTCSQIVALIVNGSKVQSSMSGQEERDVLFARLFGLTAVIQSGLVVRTGVLNTSASSAADASTLSSFEEVIKELLVLGEKKSWLRESAWWTINLAIDSLKDSQVTWRGDAVLRVIQQLFVDYDIWSPEKVALTLKLQALYPDQDWRKLCSPAFKNPDLLHTGNLQNLARVLKVTSLPYFPAMHENLLVFCSFRNQLLKITMGKTFQKQLQEIGNLSSILFGTQYWNNSFQAKILRNRFQEPSKSFSVSL